MLYLNKFDKGLDNTLNRWMDENKEVELISSLEYYSSIEKRTIHYPFYFKINDTNERELHICEYQIKFNGQKLWVCNYPYATFHFYDCVDNGEWNTRVRPSRKTTKRLYKYIEERIMPNED